MRVSLLCVAAALALGALSSVRVARANELDDYVHTVDPNYSWREIDTFSDPVLGAFTGYTLRLVSQRWGEGLVIPEHELWEHYLTIIVPTNRTATRPLGMLYMTSGSRTSAQPTPTGSIDLALMIVTAVDTGVPTAALFQCPNQPLVYLDDPEQRGRTEDALIAWGWRKFLTDDAPDPLWLARMPMTKSGTAAMSAMTEFAAQRLGIAITEFVIAGGSKRGWTAWTVAAVDSRVVAAVPLVMDELNLRENLRHHQQMLDGWSFAFNPYYQQNITALLDSPRLDSLTALVDPYAYKERYIANELPIYMVSASGDQFFMPDDSTFFSHEMGENFWMQMMPNCEHSLALCAFPKVLNGIAAFIDTLTVPGQTQRPQFRSFIGEVDGRLTFVPLTMRPTSVRLWSATSADTGRKDFRLMRLGEDGDPVLQDVIWRSEVLTPNADGLYTALPQEVPGRWVGFFIEAEYPGSVAGGGSGRPQRYTTDVSIIPRTYPVEPCSGEGCRSVLV